MFRDFVGDLISTQGVTPPQRHACPRWVARALAAGGETAWKLLPLPGAPPLTRFAAWVASQECTLDDHRARAASSATRRWYVARRGCASCAISPL